MKYVAEVDLINIEIEDLIRRKMIKVILSKTYAFYQEKTEARSSPLSPPPHITNV